MLQQLSGQDWWRKANTSTLIYRKKLVQLPMQDWSLKNLTGELILLNMEVHSNWFLKTLGNEFLEQRKGTRARVLGWEREKTTAELINSPRSWDLMLYNVIYQFLDVMTEEKKRTQEKCQHDSTVFTFWISQSSFISSRFSVFFSWW